MTQANYNAANAGKADFEWTYNRLDPRSYFSALGELDYGIPERAAPIFLRAFDAYTTQRRRSRLTVLDIGCSYGVNAAVLKYGRSMDALRRHYGAFDGAKAAPRDVLQADQRAFAKDERKRDLAIIGIDRAQFAASYAFWAGLLDDAIPENLEEADPSPHAAAAIAHCDLVISTGVVGYITERSFARILDCQPPDELPWIASFVLRMFDYGPVARMLEARGYVSERLPARLFGQRRFADAAEQSHVESVLRGRGLDTEGLESEGSYLAEFFLSRPRVDAHSTPLDRIVTPRPQATDVF
jgi:hypothetical protein